MDYKRTKADKTTETQTQTQPTASVKEGSRKQTIRKTSVEMQPNL